MLQAIKALLASKKFLMAIISMVAWAAGRFGFQLDVDEITILISPLVAAIVGQGIADAGKHKAPAHDNTVVTQVTATPPSTETPPSEAA